MKPVLLMDFGSTYTKVTAVDVDSETLLGTASSYTTCLLYTSVFCIFDKEKHWLLFYARNLRRPLAICCSILTNSSDISMLS